jgi:hypothetical protein
MALPWGFVSKITNSKHQITNKFQIFTLLNPSPCEGPPLGAI